MKRLIIAILLSTFAHGAAFSVTHNYCNSKATQTDCNGTAGCYWTCTNVDNQGTNPYNHCVACPSGTYNDGTIGATASTCTSCGTIGTGVKWDSTQLGLTTQSDCAFTANCTAAQFFSHYQNGCTACTYRNNTNTTPPIIRYSTLTNGYSVAGTVGQFTQDYIESKVCKSCGTNSMVNNNGLGCTCYANYHVSGGGNNDTQNDNKDCEPNTYKITLNDNGGSGGSGTIHEVYNTKWTNGSGTTITNVNIPALTGHTFMGYFSNPNDTTPKIGTNGTLPSHTTFTADTTLTANWENKTFTITYNVGNDATCDDMEPTVECTYNSNNCKATDPTECTYEGYLFNGWECTSGCKDSSTTVNISTNISTMSDGENMTLTAQWEPCPAGSYCTNISIPWPCPAGSTSAQASSAQTACYMNQNTSITGTNGTFTLPDNVDQIYYHDGQ